jgi:hypothetical protein
MKRKQGMPVIKRLHVSKQDKGGMVCTDTNHELKLAEISLLHALETPLIASLS